MPHGNYVSRIKKPKSRKSQPRSAPRSAEVVQLYNFIKLYSWTTSEAFIFLEKLSAE